MEKIIFEIKDQLYYTFTLAQNFFKNINLITSASSIVLLYIVFMRKWEFKKVLYFFFIIFLLFILLIRIEAFLISFFGPQDSDIPINITRLVLFAIAIIVFIYQAMIKE